MKTVGEVVDQRVPGAVVGRASELSVLRECLAPDGPVVCFIHGIPGIGKTALVKAFAAVARSDGFRVVSLDARSIEPSERGFLERLSDRLDLEAGDLQDVTRQLADARQRVIITLDTYERLRLLDSWLRRTFVPALPRDARLVLAGRFAPSSRWFTGAGWQNLVLPMRLGPLSTESSHDLLEQMDVPEDRARRIQEFAEGHPLALKLAAASAQRDGDASFGRGGISQVVQELSHHMLEEVEDRATREALVAASAVRTTTISLLAAMFPNRDAAALHEALASLPFVYRGPHGLVVHDAVREAISATCRANDPDRYRHYQTAAWRCLRSEVGDVGRSELWRYTADMLYLIENPICREAFFPSGAQELSVEPAGEEESDEIVTIAKRHEGPEAVDLIRYWWRMRPHRFRSVHGPGGELVGFYLMMPADDARAAPQDPVVQAWLDHLAEGGAAPEEALFIRRWLSRDDGESPGPVQAASWLDIKRTYMEMRPDLRRVYLTVRDLMPYVSAAEKLGFSHDPDLDRSLDGETYRTAYLEMGPASVDGWLTGLAAREMGIEADEDGLLDHGARALVVDDRRVSLSSREFEVLALLEGRLGEAVSRDELLSDVWQDSDVSSNVVDSVVYSLRRKMGDVGDRLETVRGFGYRLVRG